MVCIWQSYLIWFCIDCIWALQKIRALLTLKNSLGLTVHALVIWFPFSLPTLSCKKEYMLTWLEKLKQRGRREMTDEGDQSKIEFQWVSTWWFSACIMLFMFILCGSLYACIMLFVCILCSSLYIVFAFDIYMFVYFGIYNTYIIIYYSLLFNFWYYYFISSVSKEKQALLNCAVHTS